MNYNFKNLKKKIPFEIKYHKKKNGVLLSDRFILDHNLRSIITAYVLNKHHNINPYVISDKTTFDKKNFFRFFKIQKLNINFNNSKTMHFNIYPKIFGNVVKFYLITLFKKDKVKWLITNYKYNNIHIGDIIYDTYIRYGNKFLNPSIYNLEFLKQLFIGVYKLSIIKFYSDKFNIKFIISNQKGYISFGNLLIRYGVKNNFLTILNGYNFIKIYKNYRESLATPWRIEPNLISKTKIKKEEILNFYNKRIVFQKYGNYVPVETLKKVYGSKKNYKFDALIKKQKKKYKKINLFALHCFSDAPHVCGGLVFNDYYHQFIETLKFLKKNNDKSLWLIKPHPARNSYGENDLVENKIKSFNIDNVIICPDSINNLQLFNYVDSLVTGVSTISLEFACYGKKSIISGDAPYFHNQLFLKPKNQNEYFNLIKNINKINVNLSKKEIFLAKKILYFLEHLVNVNLRKSKILPDFNLEQYHSNIDYINKLFHNLKKKIL
jgi:hypothetical protein